MKEVMLIGCGNIGFRHLQAMCAMSTPASITVVEPAVAVHARIREQFERASSSAHRFTLTDRLPSEPGHVDLAVVATTAAHRRAVVEQLLDIMSVDVAILEKVLFPTITDLDSVRGLLVERSVDAFVNCGRRTFPGYQQLRRELRSPVDVSVAGHRLGMASNAIHFLDLLEFLNDDALDRVDLSGLTPGSVAGKRADCVEIFGEIAAVTVSGARLRLTSIDVEPLQIELDLTAADGSTVHVDELARTVARGGRATEPFAAQNVSETPEIYEQALMDGTCPLTPYDESVRQHRMFITALREHLGLSNEEDEPCPIS